VLGYRHAFHAGNFADVLKHAALALLIEALKQKPKPLLYLETHAGAGGYDLTASPAIDRGEFRAGVARLWGRSAAAPPELAPYLEAVRASNPACSGGRAPLRSYPGSPRIARHLLRPGDRMVLCELHPADHRALKAEFAGDPQVGVHRRDGYEALKAFLPPPEHRGLVLIDPAYERPGEWSHAASALELAWRRWPTGVLAAWYPRFAQAPLGQLTRGVEHSGIRPVLRLELDVHAADSPGGLNGSGLLIVNPPWQTDGAFARLLGWLHPRLAPTGQGGWRVEWLARARENRESVR
jgi:23S rRNA (adenine2030-N6)-methyltransferase